MFSSTSGVPFQKITRGSGFTLTCFPAVGFMPSGLSNEISQDICKLSSKTEESKLSLMQNRRQQLCATYAREHFTQYTNNIRNNQKKNEEL